MHNKILNLEFGFWLSYNKTKHTHLSIQLFPSTALQLAKCLEAGEKIVKQFRYTQTTLGNSNRFVNVVNLKSEPLLLLSIRIATSSDFRESTAFCFVICPFFLNIIDFIGRGENNGSAPSIEANLFIC